MDLGPLRNPFHKMLGLSCSDVGWKQGRCLACPIARDKLPLDAVGLAVIPADGLEWATMEHAATIIRETT